MGELSRLPNIGPVEEGQLNEVGMTTLRQLKELGAEHAWLRIQAIDSSACINRLLSREGAIRGVRKTLLPQERKDELKRFYNSHKTEFRR